MPTKATPKATVRKRTDVKRAKRGRKPVVNDALLDLLRQTPENADEVLFLDAFSGTSPDERAKVGQTIRNHWKMIHGENGPRVRVEWDVDSSTPTVSFRD